MGLVALSAVGCGSGGENEIIDPVTDPVYDTPIVASKAVEKEGRKYIECNGVPYLFLGMQMRVDYYTRLDGKAPEELEEYFALVRGMNVTSVQVPIAWSDVEPEKDEYTSKVIDTYMGFCNKYDLKLEILWFGSNMCGTTEGGGVSTGHLANGSIYADKSGHFTPGHVPFYISKDSVTYPRYPVPPTDWVYGRHFVLIPDAEATMAREEKALAYLMDAVWEYDRTHGGKRTVVGVQVENEPNMIYNYAPMEAQMTEAGVDLEEVKAAAIRQLDRMGRAVKNSKYSVYTRVNVAMQGDHWDFAEKVQATEGIDFVGMDAYGHNSYGALLPDVEKLQSLEGNYANIPEMGGDYSNNDALELLCFQKGAGYSVFEIASAKTEFFSNWYYIAMYDSDLNKKMWTDRLQGANLIYRNAASVLASARESDFFAFNLLTMEQNTESGSTASVEVTFSTAVRGVGYAVEKDGYLYFASTQADTMNFEGTLTGCEYGYIDTLGVWHKEGDAAISSPMDLTAERVYRAKIG